ncbi:MAG TPA: YceI family protein [Methylococcaceae bacterium]|nr:YceI family protein [Methylococcaceae bacterium]
MNKWLGLAAMALFAQTCSAGWLLDQNESRVNFITTKNVNFTELNYIRNLAGDIGDDGHATLTMDLRSVETHAPDRNERLQTGFFEVSKFPASKVTLTLDGKKLLALPVGGRLETDAAATVSLHGVEKKLEARLAVTKLKDDGLQVVSLLPVIVAVEDFGLAAGLEVMRSMVELKNIGNKVPVTFNLIFTKH